MNRIKCSKLKCVEQNTPRSFSNAQLKKIAVLVARGIDSEVAPQPLKTVDSAECEEA